MSSNYQNSQFFSRSIDVDEAVKAALTDDEQEENPEDEIMDKQVLIRVSEKQRQQCQSDTEEPSA